MFCFIICTETDADSSSEDHQVSEEEGGGGGMGRGDEGRDVVGGAGRRLADQGAVEGGEMRFLLLYIWFLSFGSKIQGLGSHPG
jgi:hypothetical protein